MENILNFESVKQESQAFQHLHYSVYLSIIKSDLLQLLKVPQSFLLKNYQCGYKLYFKSIDVSPKSVADQS